MSATVDIPAGRRWYDLPLAADYCALPAKTLRRAITSGQLAFAKPGRKYLLDKRDIDAWLQGEKRRLPQ